MHAFAYFPGLFQFPFALELPITDTLCSWASGRPFLSTTKWAVTHSTHCLLLQQRVRSPGPKWAAEMGVENEGLGDWTPGRGYRSRQSEEKCGLVCKADGVEPKQLMLCDEPMFCLGQVKRLSQCRGLRSVILDTQCSSSVSLQ